MLRKKKPIKKTKEPLERRKRMAKRLIENGGKSISKAMRDAGYSDAYASNPHKFKKTKKFKELMQEIMPDDLLAETHLSLLRAGEIQHYTFPAIVLNKMTKSKDKRAKRHIKAKEPVASAISDEEIKQIVECVPGCKLIYIRYEPAMGGKVAYYQAPDSRSRKDALDMAYKLKGSYAAEKFEEVNKLKGLSNAELADKRKTLLGFFLKK